MPKWQNIFCIFRETSHCANEPWEVDSLVWQLYIDVRSADQLVHLLHLRVRGCRQEEEDLRVAVSSHSSDILALGCCEIDPGEALWKLKLAPPDEEEAEGEEPLLLPLLQMKAEACRCFWTLEPLCLFLDEIVFLVCCYLTSVWDKIISNRKKNNQKAASSIQLMLCISGRRRSTKVFCVSTWVEFFQVSDHYWSTQHCLLLSTVLSSSNTVCLTGQIYYSYVVIRAAKLFNVI